MGGERFNFSQYGQWNWDAYNAGWGPGMDYYAAFAPGVYPAVQADATRVGGVAYGGPPVPPRTVPSAASLNLTVAPKSYFPNTGSFMVRNDSATTPLPAASYDVNAANLGSPAMKSTAMPSFTGLTDMQKRFMNTPTQAPSFLDTVKGYAPLAAGIAGGAMTLAGLARGSGSDAYDKPMKEAWSQYQKFNNTGSDWYKSAYQRYQRLFADSAPSVGTLNAVARQGGLSTTSANTVSMQQARANMARNREAVSGSMSDLYMQGADRAMQALGMYNQLADAKAQQETSFWENVAGSGIGLLGLVV